MTSVVTCTSSVRHQTTVFISRGSVMASTIAETTAMNLQHVVSFTLTTLLPRSPANCMSQPVATNSRFCTQIFRFRLIGWNSWNRRLEEPTIPLHRLKSYHGPTRWSTLLLNIARFLCDISNLSCSFCNLPICQTINRCEVAVS